jgi:hypothetical protein
MLSGSVNYEAQTNAKGERLVWLDVRVVDTHRPTRSRRELQRRDHPAGSGIMSLGLAQNGETGWLRCIPNRRTLILSGIGSAGRQATRQHPFTSFPRDEDGVRELRCSFMSKASQQPVASEPRCGGAPSPACVP